MTALQDAIGALAENLGFAPIKLGGLSEGGLLVQARGNSWGRLIFQRLVKFDGCNARDRSSAIRSKRNGEISMSIEKNIQTVKDFFAAIGRGDREALLALVAEDIEWIIPGEDWPLAGTHRGHAGLADLLETASKSIETSTEPREFVAQGDRVLVVGFARGKIKATNKTFEDDWIFAITVRDGRADQHPGIHRHAGTGAGLADGRVRRLRPALAALRPSSGLDGE